MAKLIEPHFQLIDPGRFIREFAEHLDGTEGQIELLSSENRANIRTPFLDKLEGRRLTSETRYSLIQSSTSISGGVGLLAGICGLDAERNIGYIIAQTGVLDQSERESSAYEKLELRTKLPLRLFDGGILPACRVRLSVDAQEFVQPGVYRLDSIKVGRFRWRAADLESVLPTDWFLNEATDRSLAQQPHYSAALS